MQLCLWSRYRQRGSVFVDSCTYAQLLSELGKHPTKPQIYVPTLCVCVCAVCVCTVCVCVCVLCVCCVHVCVCVCVCVCVLCVCTVCVTSLCLVVSGPRVSRIHHRTHQCSNTQDTPPEGGGGRDSGCGSRCGQQLTDIILIPAVDKLIICLKNTSAMPQTGGRQMRGLRTFLGPASYTTQEWLDLSTIS